MTHADRIIALAERIDALEKLNAELVAALEAVTELVESRQPCCPEARYTASVHYADCPYLAATKLPTRMPGERPA